MTETKEPCILRINLKDVVVPLATAVVTVAGTVLVSHYGWIGKSRDQDIKMVELGIGLLREDPMSGEKENPAREWAIRIVERYSGERFNENDRDLLLGQALGRGFDRRVVEGLGYRKIELSKSSISYLLKNDEGAARQIAAHNLQCASDIGCEK